MNQKWRETIRFVKHIFAIFGSTKKQVSTRIYLKYLTLLTFTNKMFENKE